MDYHRGSGIIRYDPYRGDMKRRTQGWCIIDVDKEITRYYRWWMKYQKHIHLQSPSWDAHISVVRGEHLHSSVRHLWKKYQGQHIEFQYAHVGHYKKVRTGLSDAQDDGWYYLVEVECQMMEDIRHELKLKTGWTFHITFGRTYEYEARKPKR